MPRENFGPGHTFLAKEEILTYEEMAKVVSSLLPLGLKKVRITGGEPLLRKDIHVLIELLRSLDPELDLALTTNGILLLKYADILYQKDQSTQEVLGLKCWLKSIEPHQVSNIQLSNNTMISLQKKLHTHSSELSKDLLGRINLMYPT